VDIKSLPCLHLFIGGAISNLYGMLAARHSRFPEIKQKGMSVTGRIVVFTSKQVNIVIYITFNIFISHLIYLVSNLYQIYITFYLEQFN
jgi:hypothetical protein